MLTSLTWARSLPDLSHSGGLSGYPPERTVRYGRGAVGENYNLCCIIIFMYKVYVLKDTKGNLYKGMTSNLE
jgi:hypothetical protein